MYKAKPMLRTLLVCLLISAPVLLRAQANRNLLNYYTGMDASFLFWDSQSVEPMPKQDRLDLLTVQKPNYLKGNLPGEHPGYADAFFEIKYFRDSDGYEVLVMLQTRCKGDGTRCEQLQQVVLPGTKPGGGGIEFWDISGTVFRHFPDDAEIMGRKQSLMGVNACMGEGDPDATFFLKVSPDHDMLFLSAPECYPAQEFELFQFKFQIHQFWLLKQ